MKFQLDKNLHLPVISGFFLCLAWPPLPLVPFLFVALVPLFLMEKNIAESDKKDKASSVFRHSFLSFFIFNLFTIYWIYNASFFGAVVAVLLGSLLMSLPFVLYHQIKKLVSLKTALTAFVIFWLAYEYLHANWDLNFPWLMLGNGFANYHSWIQWYEYVGTYGGSLWVLVVNVIAFQLIIKIRNAAKQTKGHPYSHLLAPILQIVFIILLPILFSLTIYHQYEEKVNEANIVVVQPNIDPYGEKFGSMSAKDQLERLISLSKKAAKPNTEFFIWPETALTKNVDEDDIRNDSFIQEIKKFLLEYKNGNLITGASTYRSYPENVTTTARKYEDGNGFYDVFNTAIFLENSERIQLYHKSKLVPGVEQMPFPNALKFLGPLAIDLGGSMGSLGKEKKPVVFYAQSGIGVAPIICYESIYGEYVTDYVKQGAQLLFIITNDGWWGNTSGFKQHALYAKLRAIETRRSIARSANTGISSVINQRGDVLFETEWWTQASFAATLNLNDEITFYVKYGDWIPKLASIFAAITILAMLVRRFYIKLYPGK